MMPDRAGPASLSPLAPSLAGSSSLPDPSLHVASSSLTSLSPVTGTPLFEGSSLLAGAEPACAPAPPPPPDDQPGGLVVTWGGGITIEEVLAAARRYRRHHAGLDLPAWGEVGCAGESEDPSAGGPGPDPQLDEQGEDAVMAALEDRGRVLTASELGGHAIVAPGPDLACWLACGQAAQRDDAALVTSITAWRKVTSWAQAQELAAVAELARRRRVAGAVATHGEGATPAVGADEEGRNPATDEEGRNQAAAADAAGRDPAVAAGRNDRDPAVVAGGNDHDPAVAAGGDDRDSAIVAGGDDRGPVADASEDDRDPVAELEAEFAPNEIALALTLTQGGAEYWMDLAVSLTHRLPATLVALGAGTIDLNRAKLIDQYTSSLDLDLARAVERRVLVRAEHQTSGQLRASLQRAVLAADPAAAERRRQEAERRAWVALFGDHDGTAALSGRFLPAAQAAAAWARISAMAKAMESAGAGGGMDLLRAQVFVGLLLGTLPLIPAADGGPDGYGPDGYGPDGGGPDGGGL